MRHVGPNDDGRTTWTEAGMLSEDTLQLGHQILACLEDLLVGGERHGSVLSNNLLDRAFVGK